MALSSFNSAQKEQAFRTRDVLLKQIEKSASNTTNAPHLKDLAEAYAFLVNPESGHGMDVTVKS